MITYTITSATGKHSQDLILDSQEVAEQLSMLLTELKLVFHTKESAWLLHNKRGKAVSLRTTVYLIALKLLTGEDPGNPPWRVSTLDTNSYNLTLANLRASDRRRA